MSTRYIVFKPTEIENYQSSNGRHMQSQDYIRFDGDFIGTRRVVSSITISSQNLSAYLNTDANPSTPYTPLYPGSPTTKQYVDQHDTVVSATAPSNPTEGMVWYDSTNDVLKTYDGTNWSEAGTKMVVLEYGVSTWQDFLDAYNKNALVYCKVSSGSSGYRMAFMAYTAGTTTPTEVEFQYYRSRSSHSTAANQLDEVYVYKLTNAGVWTTTQRDIAAKAIAGTGIGLTFNSSGMTISADTSVLATKADIADFGGFEVVATLPATGETNIIYLLGPIGTGADKYEEWIYANSTWTKIGETSIDLSDLNTKTFYLSDTTDLTTAQKAVDWLVAGKNPIVNFVGYSYICSAFDSHSSLFLVCTDYNSTIENNSVTRIKSSSLLFSLNSNNEVTAISTGDDRVTRCLATDTNYTTPYTPQYNGSPATKKYVDDQVSAATAGAVSDTAYGSSWDGVTGIAPSKNAVYDKINSIDALIPSEATSSNKLADKNYVDAHDTIVSATAPSSPTEGMAWYDTTNHILKVYDGTNWVEPGDNNVKVFTTTNSVVIDGGDFKNDTALVNTIVDINNWMTSSPSHIAYLYYVDGNNMYYKCPVIWCKSSSATKHIAYLLSTGTSSEFDHFHRAYVNLFMSGGTATVGEIVLSEAQTYTAGTGLALNNTEFSNTAPFNATNGGVKVFDFPAVNDDITDLVAWVSDGGGAILKEGGPSSNRHFRVTRVDLNTPFLTVECFAPSNNQTDAKNIFYNSSKIVTDIVDISQNYFAPGGTATTGYVVTKTASGYEWQAPTGGIEVDSASPIQLTKIWAGTQAQYEALGSYDSTTVYLTI